MFPNITYFDKDGKEVLEMSDEDIQEQLPKELWHYFADKLNNNSLTEEDKTKLAAHLCYYREPYYDQTWLCIYRFEEQKESVFGDTFLGCDGNEKCQTFTCKWGSYTIYLDEMTDGEKYYGWSQKTREKAKKFFEQYLVGRVEM